MELFGFNISYAEMVMIAPTVIGVFAFIAKYTENKADDKVVQLLLDIVNFLGQNSGKAKNGEGQ